jgi:hypothetical protein
VVGRGKAVIVWEVEVMEDAVLPVLAIAAGVCGCLILEDFWMKIFGR